MFQPSIDHTSGALMLSSFLPHRSIGYGQQITNKGANGLESETPASRIDHLLHVGMPLRDVLRILRVNRACSPAGSTSWELFECLTDLFPGKCALLQFNLDSAEQWILTDWQLDERDPPKMGRTMWIVNEKWINDSEASWSELLKKLHQ